MSIRIQLLGPVQAWRDDAELDLGGPQQRAVLGLIALSSAAGHRVSQAELADALWGERPPASAQNTIQTYLKNLRRQLEPDRPPRAPSRLLPRAGGGYTLGLSDVDLDLVRFRLLVTSALDADRAGDRAGAAGQLGEALRLWSGQQPLADAPQLNSHPTLVSLSGERWFAVARYGEAMLALGRAADALPTLELAAGACPLDEVIQAQLVRAYHALGKRGQAFATFHTARRQLSDELGVDPGPELSAAHHTLLAEDHTLLAEDRARARPRQAPAPQMPLPEHPDTGDDQNDQDDQDDQRDPTGVVPAQLPGPTVPFVGRTEQLRRLDELLAGHGRWPSVTVAVIAGTAGVGKPAPGL